MSFLAYLGLLIVAGGIFIAEPSWVTGLFAAGLFSAATREFLRRQYHAPGPRRVSSRRRSQTEP